MLNKDKSSKQSIVWTIDPFETKIAHRAPLAKALKVFSKALAQDVKPFSVVSPIAPSWLLPATAPSEKELQEIGTETVTQELKKMQMKGLRPPTVEVQESPSRKKLVGDTLRFAKEQNAGYIAVNTRRLLSSSPLRIGGFAEALIGNSKIPVIAVNPKAKVSNQIKNILFPTDFTRKSHVAFRKTLALASKLGAKVELLHVELPIIAPFAYSEMAPGLVADGYMKEAEKARNHRINQTAIRWLAEAKKAQVPCSYQRVRSLGPVVPPILKAAKRNRSDLISLAGYRKGGAALMGGNVREILGAARTPVLEFQA